MAHSYSAVKMYEQCPSQYKFSKIDRLPMPSGPAAERGKLIHAEIEGAIKGELGLLSDEVVHLADRIKEWKDANAQSELEFAVTEQWEQVEFADPKAAFRGIIDLYQEKDNEAIVLDFKTGKSRDYSDQVTVYSTVILATKPHIESVRIIIEFIDGKETVEYDPIPRSRLKELQTTLLLRLHAIDRDKIFAPNPSFVCRWCHYRKDNGGPCKW